LDLMKNPAALYMEGFRSVLDLKRHKELLSAEQRRILELYDRMHEAPLI